MTPAPKNVPEVAVSDHTSAGSQVRREFQMQHIDKLFLMLGSRDIAHLLLLLVPLALYDLVMSISRLSSDALSPLDVAVAVQSSLLFSLGYSVSWFGLFALSLGRTLRWAASICLSLSAFFLFALSTAGTVYSQEFGTTLGYGVIRATLSNPEDLIALTGMIPPYMLAIFAEVLLYALVGVPLIVYVGNKLGYIKVASESQRSTLRVPIKACLVGIVLCCISLLPSFMNAKGSVYGDQAYELVATAVREQRFGGSDWNVRNPLASVSLAENRKTKQRNVVLIHLESIRARSVTPYNEDIETMPYLNALSERSLIAERAYAPSSYSSKALVSVNCGTYSHPATEIKESQKPGAISANCLPELLGNKGYRTAWFQSSRRDFENWPQLSENFGYEDFYSVEAMDTDGFEYANSWGYEDDVMLEPSHNWLKENGDKPFLVNYVTNTAHLEYLAPKRYGHRQFAKNDKLNRYLNSIRYVDFFVKNLIDQYKELGLYEDTIFVFYGDHGEGFGEHGLYAHGPIPYEEGLQIPLVVHDPQRFHDGKRISEDTPINQVDIAPTILDLLGYKIRGGVYPGSSLIQPIPQDRTLMFNCRPDVTCAASLKGYEKYIYFYGRKPDEFYDLRKDPLEKNNLAYEVSKGELEKRRVEFLEWRLKTMAMYK